MLQLESNAKLCKEAGALQNRCAAAFGGEAAIASDCTVVNNCGFTPTGSISTVWSSLDGETTNPINCSAENVIALSHARKVGLLRIVVYLPVWVKP